MTEQLKRLAIVTTHPIQYNAPLFRLLTARGNIGIRVFYTWGRQALEEKYDPGFGMVVNWDIPLLEGYTYEFLENVSERPGSDHFRGIDNPNIDKQIDAWQPDVLLVYGWNFKSHMKLLLRYKGKIPVLFRGDSTSLDDTGFLKPVMRRLFLTWIYHYVNKVLYTGINNKTYFKKAFVGEKKLVLAPHAVDNGFFEDPDGSYEAKAKAWRAELGIDGGAIVFLFAGKLEKKKSPFLLLEAFRSIGFLRGSHLIFAGNGDLESSLKEKSGGGRVHFIGFQNQSAMPVVYRMGDVFVLPSEGPGETWGLAINEAMASGRPVIASDKCGGAEDLIREGVNGYLFKSGNADDLKTKMLHFAGDQERLREMGRASLAAIQYFSLNRISEVIERTVLSSGTQIVKE